MVEKEIIIKWNKEDNVENVTIQQTGNVSLTDMIGIAHYLRTRATVDLLKNSDRLREEKNIPDTSNHKMD